MKSGVLAQTQVIPSVAETNRLKNKQVKGVIESLFGAATNEIKKNGNFKHAGMLKLLLQQRRASTPSPNQGALRVQSKSSLQDSEGTCHEKLKEALN